MATKFRGFVNRIRRSISNYFALIFPFVLILIILFLLTIVVSIVRPSSIPSSVLSVIRFKTDNDYIIIGLLCIATIFYVKGSIKIINEGNEGLVERLGQYRRSLKPGLNFVIPFIDKVLVETSREQILDIAPQLALTKDGIPLEVGVVVFWKILDVQKAYYSVSDLEDAFQNVLRSGLRNEIGQLDLEQTFASRNKINQALLHQVDEGSERWGSKVTRVEIQDILLAKAVLGDVPDTIEFTFHNGIDWTAFKYSFNLVIENEGIELGIQSIEDKGNGELVVRVKVPSDANKAQVYKDFVCNYEVTVQALEAKYHAELKAKDEQITIYREKSADMTEILRLLANRPVTVEVNASAESKAMSDSTDKSQSVNIGGNVTGSTINLGAISGSVSNVVNQLPSAPDPAQPGIKELLMELQAAIENDADLPEKGKASALENVKVLAEVAQDPEQPEKKGLGSQAVTFLKGAASFLPDTAKLAEACTKLLPLITKALGLPF